MLPDEQKKVYRIERIGIITASFIYLLVFNVNLPHGDALRIVNQIEAGSLSWNPNHLLLDPLGYAWYNLLESFGFDITPLASFEIIAFVSTLISLLLFHFVLAAAGIQGWVTRILAVSALFASKNFLSLAVTQYYFMLQLPFLLGAMMCGIHFFNNKNSDSKRVKYLYISAILLAIATGIEVNNVLLVGFLGVIVGFNFSANVTWNWRYTSHFWGAAALVGFPIFITGYMASQQGNGFLTWLLTYAGANNEVMEEMYGLQLTLQGIAVSGARVVFNLFFGNIIETAGMGTVLKSIVFRETLEFEPGIVKMALVFLLMPIVGISQACLLIWSIRRLKQNPLHLYLLGWVSAYLLFAFFWNNGSNIFWFQTLPAIVLLFSLYVLTVRGEANTESVGIGRPWQLWVLGITVPVLFVINTLQTVVPVSLTDIEKYEKEYAAMLKKDDLVIVPGWDKYKWMSSQSAELNENVLMLMNMALKPEGDEQHIGKLVSIVRGHLKSGNRVVVGRVYDLDSELRPWNGLSQMGWSRANVQVLLKDFCSEKLTAVDDVIFRKLTECAR